MAKRAKALSIAQLSANPAGVVKRVRSSKGPVMVTERGRTQVVLLSAMEYERGEREREMLRDLARGEREIATGRGFSLDRVFAEADRLLASRRK